MWEENMIMEAQCMSEYRHREQGRRIRIARDDLGMSQIDLAHRIGVSPAMVGKWEKGQHEAQGENFERLAEVLDRSKAWLRFGTHPGNLEANLPSGLRDRVPVDDERALLERDLQLMLGLFGSVLSTEAKSEIASFIRFKFGEEHPREHTEETNTD